MTKENLHDFYFSQTMADYEDQLGWMDMDGSPAFPFICTINGQRYTYACDHGEKPTADFNDLKFITTAKLEDAEVKKR